MMNTRASWRTKVVDRFARKAKRLQPPAGPAPAVYDLLWHSWTRYEENGGTRTLQAPRIEWDQVEQEIRQDPSIVHYHDKERSGMLLLHLVCALEPPVHIVQLLIQSYPESLWIATTNAGITPLMIACGRNASPAVLRGLIRAGGVSLLSVQDCNGYMAIHYACRQNVQAEVLRTILLLDPSMAHPSSGQRKDGGRHGFSPTAILTSGGPDHFLDGTDQWKKLQYVLWTRHYKTINVRSTQNYSTLHAALAVGCPADILKAIVLARCGQRLAGVRDVYGNLALHYAVRQAHLDQVVCQLLEWYPTGASCPDKDGRWPLHTALKSGYSWSGGVISRLYSLNPAALTLVDPTTGKNVALQLAWEYSDTETAYCILREHPQSLTMDLDLVMSET